VVEEYLCSKRLEIQNQLNYRWINSAGKDISDILRGKLEAIDMFLDFKNVFKRMDEMKKAMEDLKKKVDQRS
jgi:hypothetical protein